MSVTSLRIDALVQLGDFIRSKPSELNDIIAIAFQENGWFDQRNCWESLHAIEQNFLQRDLLEDFVCHYPSLGNSPSKRVALILAGNIPCVGFHDVLCTYLSGHIAEVKLSSKDNKLMKAILLKLRQLDQTGLNQFQIHEDKLPQFDAVIATGSNNTARYFEQYFGSYPHIIRKNRNSIAILNGEESLEDLDQLGKDIFTHYGLGCRNVSKLFVPKNYDFEALLTATKAYNWAIQNTKYKNNYDYNLSILLVNRMPHFQSENLLITEDKSLHSRIATVHYSEYTEKDVPSNYVLEHQDEIQVVIGKDYIPFGQAQQPKLTDFADKVDTLEFLSNL